MRRHQSTLSLQEAIGQQKSFTPPYCPNPDCQHHHHGSMGFYVKNGFQKTQKFPYTNQRYRCRTCRNQFSYTYFGHDFRKKTPCLSADIFFFKVNGMTNHSIARRLNIGEPSVRIRLAELKRQAMLKQKVLEKNMRLQEPIVYDGFESFSYSQFDPCYVNTSVGKNSLYTYLATLSPLNRKGRMTEWQKKKNLELRKEFGAYPPNSIRVQTTYSIAKLLKLTRNNQLQLFSDEHKSYQHSVKFDFPGCKILHHTTSSKERRDGHNPLFAINHLHLHYRHFLASHRRETIAFNKHEAGLMDSILLKTVSKNFLEPQMYKRGPKNKVRNKQSPAMAVGITDKILTFDEFFDHKRTIKQVPLDQEEERMYYSIYQFSRRRISRYKGI